MIIVIIIYMEIILFMNNKATKINKINLKYKKKINSKIKNKNLKCHFQDQKIFQLKEINFNQNLYHNKLNKGKFLFKQEVKIVIMYILMQKRNQVIQLIKVYHSI